MGERNDMYRRIVGRDNREIEIGEKLAGYFATLAHRDLLTAAGLGLLQPGQYKVQRDTAHSWKQFATREYNNQKVAYANVPLLVVAEIARRKGKTPTVSDAVVDALVAGFMPPRAAWPRGTMPSSAQVEQMHRFLAGYLRGAEQRGLFRLR